MDWTSPQKPTFTQRTEYSGVPGDFDEPSPDPSADFHKQEPLVQQHEVDLQSHPQLQGGRSRLTTIIVQGFSLLWICPIAVLLWLNLSGHVLGSSAWCPGGKCYPQMFSLSTQASQSLIAKRDRESHNLLGALQLVAKALEVWFILICSWLVYLTTMSLAGRKTGLPIAYIDRPSDFSNLPALLDPLLWRTLPRPFGAKAGRQRIWPFILLTCLLGLLCNLMGPATAVLAIPTLQWITTENVDPLTWLGYGGGSAPNSSSYVLFFSDACEISESNAWNFSCAAYPIGTATDLWVQSYLAALNYFNVLAQQNVVTFSYNKTFKTEGDTISELTWWSPSRLMMILLDVDYSIIANMSNGASPEEMHKDNDAMDQNSYVPLNNTVQLAVQRQGPILGVQPNMWLGYDRLTYFDTTVDSGRSLRCYKNYDVANSPVYPGVLSGTFTKCVKRGEGWGYGYEDARFTIEGQWQNWEGADKLGPDLKFDIWTSDTAAFLPNGDMPTGTNPSCLPENGQVPSNVTCDWDGFFRIDNNSALATRSQWSNTIHITAAQNPADDQPTTIDLMFDYTALLNFTTYSLDPSPQTNPQTLVRTPNLPTTGQPVKVSPAWTLAAWAVDANGTLGASRSTTSAMLNLFDVLWYGGREASRNNTSFLTLSDLGTNVDYMALLPIIQTLSLVEHNIVPTRDAPENDEARRQLYRNARINVWAFGMSGRTSYLGVTVVIAGIIVVLCQGVLGFVDRRPYRSPTELLTAALEHAPSEEFRDRCHNELAVARTPFRVREGDHGFVSKFKFYKAG